LRHFAPFCDGASFRSPATLEVCPVALAFMFQVFRSTSFNVVWIAIFTDHDCQLYLEYLGDYAKKREIFLHAYCLMTNHVHMLLTAPSAGSLSGLMQDIGRRYVLHFNQRYRRSGGLWEGRYKTSAVQTERYFLTCMRYIELNPVRANMVETPGKYRWSSYQFNALGVANDLITPHHEYLSLAGLDCERQKAYRSLFISEVDDPMWNLIRCATQQGVVVGDSRFAKFIEQRLGRNMQVRPRGRPKKGV
jgi:putative transposase